MSLNAIVLYIAMFLMIIAFILLIVYTIRVAIVKKKVLNAQGDKE